MSKIIKTVYCDECDKPHGITAEETVKMLKGIATEIVCECGTIIIVEAEENF